MGATVQPGPAGAAAGSPDACEPNLSRRNVGFFQPNGEHVAELERTVAWCGHGRVFDHHLSPVPLPDVHDQGTEGLADLAGEDGFVWRSAAGSRFIFIKVSSAVIAAANDREVEYMTVKAMSARRE